MVTILDLLWLSDANAHHTLVYIYRATQKHHHGLDTHLTIPHNPDFDLMQSDNPSSEILHRICRILEQIINSETALILMICCPRSCDYSQRNHLTCSNMLPQPRCLSRDYNQWRWASPTDEWGPARRQGDFKAPPQAWSRSTHL